VRNSLRVALLGAVVVAVAVWLIAIWVPAQHANQDDKWQVAGQHALVHLTLPPSFQVYNSAGMRIQVCGASSTVRCFVSSGDPSANVAAVRAALTPTSNGPIRTTCEETLLANSPDSCSLLIPVPGSKLVVDMFARAVPTNLPIADWTYSGTYANVHLGGR
jgi:hypothetical protein